MGVDRTDVLMYGWKIPKDKFELQDPDFMDGKDELIVLNDQRCGQYYLFGQELVRGGYDGWEYTNVNEVLKDKLPEWYLVKYFKNAFEKEAQSEPEIFIFSHIW